MASEDRCSVVVDDDVGMMEEEVLAELDECGGGAKNGGRSGNSDDGSG